MFAIFSVALSVVLGGAFLLGLGKMIPVATEPPRAKAVGHAQKKGETAAFRHAQVPELLKTPEAGVKTLYDVAQFAARTFKTRDAFGSRPVLNIITEKKDIVKDGQTETKTWNFFELGPYQWWSARDFAQVIKEIGSGLRGLGYGAGDILCVYAETSKEWQAVAHGCFTQSMTISTSYATLGEDALAYALNEGPAKVVFCSNEQLATLAKISPQVPALQHVIYMGKADEALLASFAKAAPKVKLVTLDQLRKDGVAKPFDPVPPKAEDIAAIMYTSGSTGDPKGVIIPHSMVVAGIAGAVSIIDGMTLGDGSDTLIAYLPLAHILEFTVEQTCIFRGIKLGYGSPKTLLDSSVRNCLGDIKELKPTLMAGVPAVWDGVRKGIALQFSKFPPFAQKIVNTLIDLKWWLMERNLPTVILDMILFNKVKANLGGRLRAALSGGAPISKDTQRFLSTLICPIIQGYGATETCGVIAVQVPPRVILGVVGEPVPCGEIKLVDVPDAGYFSTNQPYPQGEIWIRGGNIMNGYYKKPELTKEALTDDGWFMTGDIGEIHEDGCLMVIDRKKNLVKLSHGEYIAIERLESLYTQDPMVQTLLVYADPEQDTCVSLMLPREPVLRKTCQDAGIKADDSVSFDALCKDPKVRALVLKNLLATGKKAGLKKAELISAVAVISDEWTPQNGMLTAAMKLNRKPIVKAYDGEIKKMYGKK